MAISMSIKMVVVFVLGAFMIISGSVLAWKLSEMKSVVDEIPVPGQDGAVEAQVMPASSQAGTVFFVRAYYYEEREQQDMRLSVVGKESKDSIELFDDGNHFDLGLGDGVYGGYFDSSGKEAGKYKVSAGEQELTSFIVQEKGCEIIEGEYDSEQITFVIVPAGYDDYSEFKRDAEKLLTGKDSLLTVEPFLSNRGKFAFFIVNSTEDLECEIGCRNVSTLVCCNNRKIFQEASRCSHDSMFVLINSPEECGSASSYAKICAKNSYANLVLMHELGHSFGDLADEYVYADYFGDYAIGKIDDVNCDISGCMKWNNSFPGCYEGCTYSNLYRQKQKNSIMYDLYPEFNEVCKSHIESIIDGYSESPVVSQEKSYILNLEYHNGTITPDAAFLKPVLTKESYRKSDYSIELTGKGGSLFKTSLYVPNRIFPIPGHNSTIVYESDFEFMASVPFYNDGEEIRVYRQDKPVASIKVGTLSDRCGNGICEEGETRISCVVDCMIRDNFCESSSCDPDCPGQENCEAGKSIVVYSAAALIISGFLLMTFLTVWMIIRR